MARPKYSDSGVLGNVHIDCDLPHNCDPGDIWKCGVCGNHWVCVSADENRWKFSRLSERRALRLLREARSREPKEEKKDSKP